MAEIILRPLVSRDRIQWEPLWQAYLEFYETEVSAEVCDTAFQRLTSSEASEFQGIVAERDGQLIGIAHFLVHRFLWTIEDTAYLMDLFVHPDGRGKGVARRLIEACHAAAKASGAPTLYWMTQDSNQKARRLYDSLATQTDFLVYEKQ